MYITEMVPLTGRRSKKIMIKMDDGTSIVLYKKEAARYGLDSETEITEDVWDTMMREVFIPRARSRAMHLLEKQDRTKANLRQKLREGGYPEDAISVAIAYVEGYHYIDDMRYAASYVRYHQYGKSRRRIRMDLRQKGVDDDLIDIAMDSEFTMSEEDMIRQTLDKKHYDPESADIKERQKICRFLIGRGFSYEDVDRVMRDYSRVG